MSPLRSIFIFNAICFLAKAGGHPPQDEEEHACALQHASSPMTWTTGAPSQGAPSIGKDEIKEGDVGSHWPILELGRYNIPVSNDWWSANDVFASILVLPMGHVYTTEVVHNSNTGLLNWNMYVMPEAKLIDITIHDHNNWMPHDKLGDVVIDPYHSCNVTVAKCHLQLSVTNAQSGASVGTLEVFLYQGEAAAADHMHDLNKHGVPVHFVQVGEDQEDPKDG